MIGSFLRDIGEKFGYPRCLLLLTLLLVSGLTEGCSMLLFLPLFASLGGSVSQQPDQVTTLFKAGLATLGLPMSATVTVCAVVGAFVLQASLFLLHSRLTATMQHRYTYLWRTRAFEAILKAKWRFFVDRKAGELVSLLTLETDRMCAAFSHCAQVLVMGLFVAIYLCAALLVSWQATLGLVLVGICLTTLARPLQRRALATGHQLTAGQGFLHTLAGEFLGGAKMLKATAMEQRAAGEFSSAAAELDRMGRSYSFDPSLVRAMFEFAGILALVTTLVLGTRTLGMDLGAVLVIMALFMRLYPRLSSMQQGVQILYSYLPGFQAVRRLLAEAEAEGEASPPPPPRKPDVKPVAVSIRDLVVRHPGKLALDRVSIELSAGRTVAVVGASGGGKSTLADALLRLIDPTEGDILIDGTRLADLPLAQWRHSVGYMQQDTVLFHASIRENIAWGAPQASQQEIEAAARLANAHDFILATENGYDTLVGDRGVRLSGGQRQRLGLARALLGTKSLLIMDEATSALDAESEGQVMRSIEALRGNMTIMIISHRLSSVRSADRIVLIAEGRVVESGSWDELTAAGGPFAALWEMQRGREAAQ